MTNETEEKKEEGTKGLESFDENNMFNTFELDNEQEEEAAEALEGFTDFSGTPKTEEEGEDEDDKDEESEEEETDKDDINFEDEKLSEEEKIDLEAFNKKFSQSFKSEQELQEFLKGKTQEEEADKDDQILLEASNQLSILEPYLELDASGIDHKIDDEKLMRSQFETIAVKEGKDLNNEDVQIDIEEKIQELHDSGKFYKQANLLRNNITKAVDGYTKIKETITDKRATVKLEQEKLSKEKLQNEFVGLHSQGNFYGIDIDKKTIAEVYRNVASGKFIENLKTDNKAIAELALMAAYKEKIFKKSTGLTYNEGMKAILDEFKSKGTKESLIAKAQKRGSAGSTEGSKGLIDSILYEAPKEKK